MIIGFDGSRAFSPSRTGTENYSYQLLKALIKIDKVNRYVVFLRPNINVLDTGVQQTLKPSSNIEFRRVGWKKLWTQGGLALQTFKDKFDILFVPAHTLPVVHKVGLKTVVTVHDLGSEYLPKAHQLRQRLYLSFIQKYQLKNATKIIAVSYATKDDLVKNGIEEEKIAVIYEGYEKSFQKPLKNDLFINTLNKYVVKNKDYFLFVGTVQPRKNLERVIIAFRQKQKKTDDLQLVIAGSKGWLSDEIYKLPKKLGIEEKVKFLGYVPDEDMTALYSGAKALVFPSLFEGFGLPILEAQACGCPVLTSNISSMPEVAGKGAILVDPYSIDDIVKGMIEIQKSNIKNQIVREGYQNIKRFSWEKCAAQTLKVFKEL